MLFPSTTAATFLIYINLADADGFVWAALSGAGRVVRIHPTLGHVDFIVHLPVKSPTSCTFGGRNLDTLFITTRGPDGGGLYSLQMPHGIRGLAEPELQLEDSTSIMAM
ncbi:hypothetical protein ACA910_007020 [Epithemia clementina (nom. ined.)]